MKNLLYFIIRNHYVILFLMIESFSLALVVHYNNYQHTCALNSSAKIAGNINQAFSVVNNYIGLRDKNEALNAELAKARSVELISYKVDTVSAQLVKDPNYIQQYEYIPCQVISNSVNNSNNFLTINVGKKHGVERGMGVVSASGVIGVVKETSDNFASVISVLNPNLNISAMLKANGYFGSLSWEGYNYQYAAINDLPSHIEVHSGDTVITSGYSAIFPKGMLIGTIDTVLNVGTNGFMVASVKLSVDFKRVGNVQVIKNLLRDEQLELEMHSGNE